MSRPFVKIAAGLAAVALPLSAVTAVAGAAGNGGYGGLGAINKQNAIANEVPSAIKTAGKLRVASDATYAPMEYLAPDNTTVIGVDADLAKAVGKVLGLPVQIDNVTFDSIIPKLQSNTYDLGFSSFTDTMAREHSVNFVDYFSAGESFYIKKGHKALSGSGLTQLCALRYGAIPVVSRVGGLNDTIIEANEMALNAGVATGIQFSPVTTPQLIEAIRRATALYRDAPRWKQMQQNAMRADVSWDGPARAYVQLYRQILS